MRKFRTFNEFTKAKDTGLGGPVKTEKVAKGKKAPPSPHPGKDPGLMRLDGGPGKEWGDMAAPGMTPQNSHPVGEKPLKKVKDVKHSKGMKAESAKYIAKMCNKKPITECLHDATGRKLVPIPTEAIRYACQLAVKHGMMARLVNEMKKAGGLKALTESIKLFPEGVDAPAEMRFGKGNLDKKKKHPNHQDHEDMPGDEDDMDMDDDDMDHDDMDVDGMDMDHDDMGAAGNLGGSMDSGEDLDMDDLGNDGMDHGLDMSNDKLPPHPHHPGKDMDDDDMDLDSGDADGDMDGDEDDANSDKPWEDLPDDEFADEDEDEDKPSKKPPFDKGKKDKGGLPSFKNFANRM